MDTLPGKNRSMLRLLVGIMIALATGTVLYVAFMS